jgi:hypothetical protein
MSATVQKQATTKRAAPEAHGARAAPNPLMPMLINTLSDGPSIMLLVPYLGIRALWLLSCANQEMRARLVVMAEARKLWAELAVRIAGFPGKGFEPEKLRALVASWPQELVPFFDQMRALICPWTSMPDTLPLRILFRTVEPHPRYMVLNEAGTRLIYQSADPREPGQASSLAERSPDFAKELNLYEPKTVLPHEELHPAALMVQVIPPDFFIPDFSAGRNLVHRYHFVHGGVFAAIECHNHRRSVAATDGYNGVYFFSCADGRMLRHMALEDMTNVKTSFMQSRPTRLWIMVQNRVLAFRPDPFTVARRQPILASPTEQMDPALWMAANGDTAGAMRFLTSLFRRQNIRDVIDVRSAANRRSLLHYAASEGQTETCRALVDAGANITTEDCSYMTPISLAVSKLHHDAAVLLIERRGEMEVDEFSKVWWELCNLNHTILRLDEASVRDQSRRIIPGILRALLFTAIPTRPSFILNVHLQRAMESMFILSSPDATTLVLQAGGHPFLEMCQKHKDIFNRIFCTSFPTPTHEKESFETVKALFTEFGLDVNRNISVGARPVLPLVHAVMRGDLDLVRFMIEELGADIRVTRQPSGEDLRILAIGRTMANVTPEWREESRRVREYIEALFQQHGIISPYWNPPVVAHAGEPGSPAAG